MKILDILDELAGTNSRNEKIAILNKHKDNKTLQQVCFLALDPRTQFYIKKIPSFQCMERPSPIDWALDELERFSTRELTGNAAIEHLQYVLGSLSEADAEVISRVIQRDLKCGVNDSTVNKVWKNLIPDYPYMRASLPKDAKLSSWNWSQGVFSQKKSDGMFININYHDDVEFLSRSGSLMPKEAFYDLSLAVRSTLHKNTQTHGELLVIKEGKVLPREIGNGILTSVMKGGKFAEDEIPVIEIWDQIEYGKDRDNRPYHERYQNIVSQVNNVSHGISVIETKMVYSLDEALEHYRYALERGFEGTIIKNPLGVWKNTTSKDQVKMKLEISVDLVITGFIPGKGKNESTFGSITCESSDGLLSVNVSGFKEKKARGVLTREEIWDKRDSLMGSVITVRANTIMPPTKSNSNYSLFLPRFVEFRFDKSEADSLKMVQEQFDNAVKFV
jgi:DNA ligase-1